jgi:hypothetical protein
LAPRRAPRAGGNPADAARQPDGPA